MKTGKKTSKSSEKKSKKILKKSTEELVKNDKKNSSVSDDIIPKEFIKYADENLDRPKSIKELSKIISDNILTKEVEDGIYRFSITYVITNNYINDLLVSVYENKLNEIIRAIEISPELLADIKNGNINPSSVAFM